MRKVVLILGVPVDDLNMAEALARLDDFIVTGRSTGRVHQVATVNADFVVRSLDDPELRRILQEADMATPDGMPLVWGARLLGVHLEGRVTGADLVPALAALAAQKGYSLYLLGAAPGIAQRAADILVSRNPGLKIAGVYSPPYHSLLDVDEAMLAAVKAAQPDVLLVAFGNPKQEKWIGMHARRLGVPVSIGVGGTLDMIAGLTRRAPLWMQRAGLEWLYRLLQEPRRLWRRYVTDLLRFGPFFLRQWWVMRRGGGPSPVLPLSAPLLVQGTAILSVRGRLDVHNWPAFAATVEEVWAQTPYLIVNLAEAAFLDSTAMGGLVALSKHARDLGGALRLAAVPPAIARVLALMRLDRFFEVCQDVESALAAHRAAPEPAPPMQQGKWTVIRMPQRLDAATEPEMMAQCSAALAASPHLVLDFTPTFFLASAGLAALVKLSRQAREKGGELRIAGCSADCLRVIKLARLDGVLALFADVRAAIARAQ